MDLAHFATYTFRFVVALVAAAVHGMSDEFERDDKWRAKLMMKSLPTLENGTYSKRQFIFLDRERNKRSLAALIVYQEELVP
jgi:hypothetical protein